MSADLARPRSLSAATTLLLAALAVIGLLTFAWGVSGDADRVARTYRVFLHNWLLWAALAQGALCVSAAFRLSNATWTGPLQRLTESLSAFFPLSLVLYLVIWAGRHHLFHWIDHPEHIQGKEWWYSEGFAFGRDLFVLLWMTFVSSLYLYISLRPALARAREESSGWRRALYARWAAGWRGDDPERELAVRRGRKIAAVLALSYAFGYSVLAVDLVMSLAPEWVSTMFPAYFAWGGFLSAVSLLTLVTLTMRNSPELAGEVTPARLHDLGKMVFAFSIFWMYLFWSQYLVIWYGNIPEETGFVAARLGSEFVQDTWYFAGFWQRIGEPYARLTLFAWILIWVLPFWVLLGQRPKRTPTILGVITAGSIFGFWIERYILVTPSLVPPADVLSGAPVTPTGLIEVGLGLGFVGLFLLCFLAFARVFPGALPPRD